MESMGVWPEKHALALADIDGLVDPPAAGARPAVVRHAAGLQPDRVGPVGRRTAD